jgi:hypothetical protein
VPINTVNPDNGKVNRKSSDVPVMSERLSYSRMSNFNYMENPVSNISVSVNDENENFDNYGFEEEPNLANRNRIGIFQAKKKKNSPRHTRNSSFIDLNKSSSIGVGLNQNQINIEKNGSINSIYQNEKYNERQHLNQTESVAENFEIKIRKKSQTTDKKSLYDKLQDSLKTYIKDHKSEVVLIGTTRYEGKSGEYYLKANKSNSNISSNIISDLNKNSNLDSRANETNRNTNNAISVSNTVSNTNTNNTESNSNNINIVSNPNANLMTNSNTTNANKLYNTVIANNSALNCNILNRQTSVPLNIKPQALASTKSDYDNFYKSDKLDSSNTIIRIDKNENKLNSNTTKNIHNNKINVSNNKFKNKDTSPYANHIKATDTLIDVIKDRVILKELHIAPPKIQTKVLTAVIDKKKTNSLTPIPTVFKSKLKNKVEKNDLTKAERTAVQIRRIEYSNSMQNIISRQSISLENLKIAKCVRIQRWWTGIYFKFSNARKIQSNFRGFISRKKFFEFLQSEHEKIYKLMDFERLIRRPFIRRSLNGIFSDFAKISKEKRKLKFIKLIQRRVREYLSMLRENRYNGFFILHDLFRYRELKYFRKLKYMLENLKYLKILQHSIKFFLFKKRTLKNKLAKFNSRIFFIMTKFIFSKFIFRMKSKNKINQIRKTLINLEDFNLLLKLNFYFNKLKKRINLIKFKENKIQQATKLFNLITKGYVYHILMKNIKIILSKKKYLIYLVRNIIRENNNRLKESFLIWTMKTLNLKMIENSKFNIARQFIKIFRLVSEKVENRKKGKSFFHWWKLNDKINKIYKNFENLKIFLKIIKNLIKVKYFNLTAENLLSKYYKSKKIKSLRLILKNKSNFALSLLLKFFSQWKKNALKLLRRKLTSKVFIQLSKKKIDERIKKYFNLWLLQIRREITESDKKNFIRKISSVSNAVIFVESLLNKDLLSHKKLFFDHLSKIYTYKIKEHMIKFLFRKKEKIIRKILKLNFNNLKKKNISLIFREEKLFLISKKIDSLIKYQILKIFQKWKYCAKNSEIYQISLMKISSIKILISKIKSVIIKNILINFDFLSSIIKCSKIKRLKNLVKISQTYQLFLLKTKFKHFHKFSLLTKSKQTLMNEMMKKMFNIKFLFNLLHKILFQTSYSFGKIKQYSKYKFKLNHLKTIILEKIPKFNKKILHKVMNNFRLYLIYSLEKDKAIKIRLRQIFKTNAIYSKNVLLPEYLIKWKEQSEKIKIKFFYDSVENLKNVMKKILMRNLNEEGAFSSIKNKSDKIRKNNLIKKFHINKEKDELCKFRFYLTKWKEYILRFNVTLFRNHLLSLKIKKISKKLDKLILKDSFKMWKYEVDRCKRFVFLLKPILVKLVRKEIYNDLVSYNSIREAKNLSNRIFKKLIMKNLNTYAREFEHLNKLTNIVKMTVLHKETSKNTFLLEIIKKWRFLTFAEKLSKRKMADLYKGVFKMYQNMTEEMFSDKPESYNNNISDLVNKIYMQPENQDLDISTMSNNSFISSNNGPYKKPKKIKPGDSLNVTMSDREVLNESTYTYKSSVYNNALSNSQSQKNIINLNLTPNKNENSQDENKCMAKSIVTVTIPINKKK